MNEEQEFKQAALTAGMLNLKEEFDNRFRKVVEDWQNAVAALLLNVDETWRAKNEVSWFEKMNADGYDAIKVGKPEGALTNKNIFMPVTEFKTPVIITTSMMMGEASSHDNIAGYKVWDGKPVLEVKGAPFDEKLPRDWSKAKLEDVPVDWMPEVGQTYCNPDGDGWLIENNWPPMVEEHKKKFGRLFPTAALAQQYLDSQKPVEPVYGKTQGQGYDEIIRLYKEKLLSDLNSGKLTANEYILLESKRLPSIDEMMDAIGLNLHNRSQATPSKVPVERWKPTKGEMYWFITGRGTPNSTLWDGGHVDNSYFDFGNCFQTIEEALAARDRVKKALKGE